MSTTADVPSSLAVLRTIIGLTWRRLFRGRALWVSALIASLPVILTALLQGQDHNLEPIIIVMFLVMVLLPPMFVASSLGEEIEDRTTTYLWSRPIGRWTIVIGKLIALAPIAMMLVIGGGYLAIQIETGEPPSAAWIAGTAGGSLAISSMAAGVSVLVPKYGMALSIVYLVIIDLIVGAMPASINNISITKQVRSIAYETDSLAQPAITMAVLAGIWLAVALWRIRRLES
jgi:ABC-type transport system involved in multi-copper enzyme maturation permease subunit